jgi:hypothetical protein
MHSAATPLPLPLSRLRVHLLQRGYERRALTVVRVEVTTMVQLQPDLGHSDPLLFQSVELPVVFLNFKSTCPKDKGVPSRRS